MVVARDGGFAVILSEPGKKITPTDKANAFLVSAAPDLLATIHELLSYIEQLELVAYEAAAATDVNPVVQRAVAVIAKAEGR